MNEPVAIERSAVEARLATLQSEAGAGRRLLAEAQARVDELRQQLLRIDGAQRVLREFLEAPREAAFASRDA
jgi:hypothetical protein